MDADVVEDPEDPEHVEVPSRLRRWRRRIIGRRPRRRLAAVVVVLIVAVLVDGLLLWGRVDRFAFRPSGSPSGGTTYLLVGSDSRAFVDTDDERMRYGDTQKTPGERADVLLVLRVGDDGSRRLLRISRDLLVVGESGSPIRIAETLSDGPQHVADALCDSLGIGIDHMAVMNLNGLRDVVNSVGGIELTMDTPVRDLGSGLSLPAGDVHLDGDETLAYVGSWHLEHYVGGRWTERPSDAVDRPGRAAEVLRLVGERIDLPLWAPWRAHDVAWAATGGLAIDDTIGFGDAVGLRDVVLGLGGVSSVGLPVKTTPGRLPIDNVDRGAGKVIREFEGSKAPARACADPAFPLALT